MKTIPYRVAVTELWPSAQYQTVLEKIGTLKPIVPAYQYNGESNIEEIKFKLAQLQMFELVMSILQGKAND